MATSTNPISNALAYLVATFRAEVDSYQVRAYQRALADIDGETVMAAAERLINQAANGRKFYPLPTAPEWKQACRDIIAQKRKAAFAVMTEACEHAAFMEEYQDERGVWWTRRCACYRQGIKAMAAAGRPLALPSYADEDNP